MSLCGYKQLQNGVYTSFLILFGVLFLAQYRKAERIIQRKRRGKANYDSIVLTAPTVTPTTELLARSFYSWVQVRNVGAVDKVNNDRALYNYQRCIVRRMFRAWHFHLVSHTQL